MIAKKPWGQPLEVPALEFPETNVMMKDNPHFALLVDVYLRLEQTPRSKAIAVPFDTDRDARRAVASLIRLAKSRVGEGHIEFRRAVRDGVPVVYVRRGPNWGKNGKLEQVIRRQEKEGNADDRA